MLKYTIAPKSLGAHLLSVSIDIVLDTETITAKLPKWIPGSYKIRDYSRFIQRFRATAHSGEPLNWRKLDSDTWEIDSQGGIVTLAYEVYAYDLSVRGAYLDDTRLFFNHCCVALDIVELNHYARTIEMHAPNDWRIFTALPDLGDNCYEADNYNHQIDCPVEATEQYLHSEFSSAGVRHEVIFTGAINDIDMDNTTQHLKNICDVENRLFGGSPLDKYLFMTYLEPKVYGGLEHKNSVAQMASPDMMLKADKPLSPRMIDFLALCSHEYFHLWNIKRLQPKTFQPYNLYREQNTEMLWLFEGFTSYYDELFLLRAGVVDAQTFLQRQAANLTRVLNVPGRFVQPLAASSFDAWTKLYQADANSPNNMVSYYSKGAVFALYLDLFIRKHSNGEASLDNVMQHLWAHFGKKGIGINEDDAFTVCAQLLPAEKHQLLAQLFVVGLHGTDDLPLQDMLPDFGVDYATEYAKFANIPQQTNSGMRLKNNHGSCKIAFLHADSHAAEVGVSVDDELLAINHQSIKSLDAEARLNLGKVDEILQLTLSRRGRVFEKQIRLTAATKNQINFTLQANHNSALSESWLAVWV